MWSVFTPFGVNNNVRRGEPYLDNFEWMPFSGMYAIYDALEFGKPKKDDEIFKTNWCPRKSQHWQWKIHKHINLKYRGRMVEICKSDYSILGMMQWSLGHGIRIAAGGMKHWSTSSVPDYGLYYISLLYRTKKVESAKVWKALEDFLKHLGYLDPETRPHRVYLRVCGNIAEDKKLKHLSLLNYRPSKATKEDLEDKWYKYAYVSNLEGPCRDNYWCIKPEYYSRPDRKWSRDLPAMQLLDSVK